MSFIDWVVIAIAVAVAWPMACRNKILNFHDHRLDVVALHQALGIGVIWSAYYAAIGHAGMVELCSVVAAALWIAISYWSWRWGVPEWVLRNPPSEPGPAPGDAVLQRAVNNRSD